MRFEVDVQVENGGCRSVTVFGFNEAGQGVLVGGTEFGPFDTDLEVSQWVWRTVTRHLASAVR
jgi:hypothetical protein